jgi:cell division transport system ATP-binding protein
MVSLTAVSKSYFGKNRVLDQITLELKRGEFLYVVGGTGVGKSTLLRLVATEEMPTSGTISLFGYNLANAGSSTLKAIRRSLGYVPQDIRLIPDLSVYDNVALSVSLAGKRAISGDLRTHISELLERLGLAQKSQELAGSLSGGEAQRVAVARALARNPELIVADEPTGAQDRDATWALMDLLLRANVGGASVIVATHDREIVRRVRRRCAMLKGGRMSFEEPLCIY